MSPVSCLMRLPSTEKPKKRVRFNIDMSAPGDPAFEFGSPENSPGSLTPPPALICPESGEPWFPQRSAAGQTARAGSPAITRLEKPRWWRAKVSSLGLVPPLTVLPSVPVQDAVAIMDKEGYDQLPVVDKAGDLCGIVTLKCLVAALLVRRVETTSPVFEVMHSQYETVSRDETLGSLSEILEEGDFALIIHAQRRVTVTGEVAPKEIVIGIVTRIDLLNHVVSRCAA